jgi:hypothetical protein
VQLAKSTTDGAGACGSPKTIDDQKGPHQPNTCGAPEHKRGSILNTVTGKPVEDRPISASEAKGGFKKNSDDPYGYVKGSDHWEKVYYDETFDDRGTKGGFFAVRPFVAAETTATSGDIPLFEENPYADAIPEDKLKEILNYLQAIDEAWIVPDHKQVPNPDRTIVIFTGRNTVTDPITLARIDSYSKQLIDYLSANYAGDNIKIIISPEQSSFAGESIAGEGIIAVKFTIKALSYGF